MPDSPMSYLDALMLLSVGQCLFVATLLGLSPRHQDPADRWMGATLLAFCLNSIVNLAYPQLAMTSTRHSNSTRSWYPKHQFIKSPTFTSTALKRRYRSSVLYGVG